MHTKVTNSISIFFKTLTIYSKKNLKLVLTITFLIVFFLVYSAFFVSKPVNETTSVKYGTLSQYVRVTGSVKTSNDASLSFQIPGQVAYVGVKVGDTVQQGKLLASLSKVDSNVELLKAKASLESAQVTLDQLKSGPREEEVAIKQQALDNAEIILNQAYLTSPDIIRNVESTVVDVVKNKMAPIFSYIGNGYVLSFSSCDQSLQGVIESDRSKLEKKISELQSRVASINSLSSREEIDTVFEEVYLLTISTNNLISNLSSLLFSSCSTQNSGLDSYRSTLSTVRSTISTTFGDISSKRSSLISSRNSFTQASRDLSLIKAGTDPYKILSQKAVVSQAEAAVASAESSLAKTSIFAPFSGVIGQVDIVPGENVSSGKTVISMVATNSFEVDANVPEVDIVKIKVGSKVNITLDAYGAAAVFPANVTRISPTATMEGNVPVYKVLVTFVGSDQRIKSGMTANINILTEEINNTLIATARFIKFIDETKGEVIVIINGVEVTKEVTLGARGENGFVEIKSGVKDGDVLVAPGTDVRSAQKQTN